MDKACRITVYRFRHADLDHNRVIAVRLILVAFSIVDLDIQGKICMIGKGHPGKQRFCKFFVHKSRCNCSTHGNIHGCYADTILRNGADIGMGSNIGFQFCPLVCIQACQRIGLLFLGHGHINDVGFLGSNIGKGIGAVRAVSRVAIGQLRLTNTTFRYFFHDRRLVRITGFCRTGSRFAVLTFAAAAGAALGFRAILAAGTQI